MTIDLARPAFLIGLGLIPLWWWWLRPNRERSVLTAHGADAYPFAVRVPIAGLVESVPTALMAAALACLVVALCQPRAVGITKVTVQDGVGIVIAIDLSTSMRAEDMAEGMTRLQAAKASTLHFISRRRENIGIVVFAGEALTRLPLTGDRLAAERVVAGLETGLLRDGTDIAGATVAAGSLFREFPQRSRIVVLLTDGAHNKPGLEPAQAARAVAAFGVRINAIALGGKKTDGAEVAAMETVSSQTARITGGGYFRATDVAGLDRAFSEIDRQTGMQSSRVVDRPLFRPIAYLFVLAALAFATGSVCLRGSRWGVIP